MKTPFTISRRILWGDCDPAGVIYTPRVFDYAIEAIEDWHLAVTGHDFNTLHNEFNLDLPTVKMACLFKYPMRTGEVIDITVSIKKLGGSSINYGIDGFNQEKQHCFEIDQVSCFVSRSNFEPVRIPPEFKDKFAAYCAACEAKAN